MFCFKCGAKLEDGAAFCMMCGASQNPNAQAAKPAPVPAPAGNQPSPVPAGKKIRYKCPKCGRIADTQEGAPCSGCGAPQEENCGYYKLHRIGGFVGVANPFSIYLNGAECGRIGNKQTCWIKLPYGSYTVHIACGMNRKCNDPVITLTPVDRVKGGKVYMKKGFTSNSFIVEDCPCSEIPD